MVWLQNKRWMVTLWMFVLFSIQWRILAYRMVLPTFPIWKFIICKPIWKVKIRRKNKLCVQMCLAHGIGRDSLFALLWWETGSPESLEPWQDQVGGILLKHGTLKKSSSQAICIFIYNYKNKNNKRLPNNEEIHNQSR